MALGSQRYGVRFSAVEQAGKVLVRPSGVTSVKLAPRMRVNRKGSVSPGAIRRENGLRPRRETVRQGQKPRRSFTGNKAVFPDDPIGVWRYYTRSERRYGTGISLFLRCFRLRKAARSGGRHLVDVTNLMKGDLSV